MVEANKEKVEENHEPWLVKKSGSELLWCNGNCRAERDACMALSPKGCEGRRTERGLDSADFFCTRPKGHEGNHVACGYIEHNYAVWPNEEG